MILRDGPITDHERFTEGDCHILARAIHVRTGWPIHAFVDEAGYPDWHAFVVMPDGRALDVQGACDMEEFCERWGQPDHAPFSWARLRRDFDGPQFGQYSYRRAGVIAERLLDSLAITV